MSSEVFIYLQSVQAYISPPIAAVFLFGMFWPRANRHGAIAALASGAVLGGARFILELNRGSALAQAPIIARWSSMNFLHFAIVLFLVCAAVLVVVSMLTPAPDRRALAGLTFATVDEKLQTTTVSGAGAPKPPPETGLQHRINVALSAALVLTVISLWISLPLIAAGEATVVGAVRARVDRDRAVAAFTSGVPGGVRRLIRGPLRSVAQIYLPFRLHDVTVRRGRRVERLLIGIDAVAGVLDLYRFDDIAVAERARPRSGAQSHPTAAASARCARHRRREDAARDVSARRFPCDWRMPGSTCSRSATSSM